MSEWGWGEWLAIGAIAVIVFVSVLGTMINPAPPDSSDPGCTVGITSNC